MPHKEAETLTQLYYTSQRSDGVTGADLRAMVGQARVANRVGGITGLLLQSDRLFFQFVEGPEDRIRALMERIRRDPRHGDVREAPMLEAEARLVEQWSMMLIVDPSEDQFVRMVRARTSGVSGQTVTRMVSHLVQKRPYLYEDLRRPAV